MAVGTIPRKKFCPEPNGKLGNWISIGLTYWHGKKEFHCLTSNNGNDYETITSLDFLVKISDIVIVEREVTRQDGKQKDTQAPYISLRALREMHHGVKGCVYRGKVGVQFVGAGLRVVDPNAVTRSEPNSILSVTQSTNQSINQSINQFLFTLYSLPMTSSGAA